MTEHLPTYLSEIKMKNIPSLSFLLLISIANATRQERRITSSEQVEIIISSVEDRIQPQPASIHRGLVPQLWPNYTRPELPDPEDVPCDEAVIKCAFRSGCLLALQNYELGCYDLVRGKSQICNKHCRHSLIALMSTHEGERLMKVCMHTFFKI